MTSEDIKHQLIIIIEIVSKRYFSQVQRLAFVLLQQERVRGGMLEEHSLGLVTASVVSVVVCFFGLVVNVSSLAMQYTSSASCESSVRIGNSRCILFLPRKTLVSSWL